MWKGSRGVALLMVALGCVDPEVEGGDWASGELERLELTLVDQGRVTPSLGEHEGSDERRIDVVFQSYSAEATDRPLVVMAHGHGGDPDKLERFGHHLASEGYAIAAVRFPISHEGSGAGPSGLLDLEEQRGDLRFVLDQLEALVEDAEHPFYRRFQADDVIALGHSLGGITVLGWTRYEAPDPRVSHTVLVAPAVQLGSAFGGRPERSGPPTLILHGAEDPLLPKSGSEELYERLDSPVTLVVVDSAGHSDLIEAFEEPPIPAREAAQQATRAFLDLHYRGDEAAWKGAMESLSQAGHEVRDAP